MKNFSKVILGCIFTILITCSIQSVDADHHLSGNSIFKDLTHVNLVDERNSEYQIYLQVEVRNAQGQLISISEDSIGRIIPHELTDHTFNEKLGKIEIVTNDNIKYEKVQYTYTPALENRFVSLYPIFSEIHFELQLSVDDVASMHSKNIDYMRWQIHYCATITGHGDECIPVFQVLVPTMTLEPHDVVTHQWTILRIIN